MVTFIPVVFGAGKWAASLPTGFLLHRLGRVPLMVSGLGMIAACDIASLMVVDYAGFLAVRGVAGAGWAMFATVATTAMIQRRARGRAISLLLMSESLGLLLGSMAGGWLFQSTGPASPFLMEAACMVFAAAVVAWLGLPAPPPLTRNRPSDVPSVREAIRAPGVMLACVVNAATMGVQTGVLVFLFPLYLTERGHFGPVTVGYLVSLTVVGRLFALWIGGRISDRHDRMSVLAVAMASFAIVLGALPAVTDPWLLGVWSVLIGIGGGLVAGLPTAIVGDRVDPAQHGIAIGWLRTVTDAGMLVGPLVMGPLADALGLGAPFLLAALALGGLAGACRRQARAAR
jgi:predicted MFS family arabinose efflux permease